MQPTISDDSMESTICDMNWSGIRKDVNNKSQSQKLSCSSERLRKSFEKIKCSYGHNAYCICVNEYCKKSNGFVCVNQVCKCKLDHQICQTLQTSCILEPISDKFNSIDQTKKYICDFFDKKIEQVFQLRSYYLKEVQSITFQQILLTDLETKFLNVVDRLNVNITSQKMKGNQLSALLSTYKESGELKRNNIRMTISETFQRFQQSFKRSTQELLADFCLGIESFKTSKHFSSFSFSPKAMQKHANIPQIVRNSNQQKPISSQNSSHRLHRMLNQKPQNELKILSRQRIKTNGFQEMERNNKSINKTQPNSIIQSPSNRSKSRNPSNLIPDKNSTGRSSNSSKDKRRWVP